MKAAAGANRPGAEATKQLSDVLVRLAKSDEATRAKAEKGHARELDTLRDSLRAEPVTLETLPPEIRRDWLTATDGREGLGP